MPRTKLLLLEGLRQADEAHAQLWAAQATIRRYHPRADAVRC